MAVSLNPLGLLIWSNLDHTIEFQDRQNVINKGTFCYKFSSMSADRAGLILYSRGEKYEADQMNSNYLRLWATVSNGILIASSRYVTKKCKRNHIN